MDQEALIICWFEESHRIANLIASISEALARLCDKRRTLEERIIIRNLCELTAGYGAVLNRVNLLLAKDLDIPERAITSLRDLNSKADQAIGDLLKMIRFNLNYLEQYYEHTFAARLTEEHRFPEAINSILEMF